jgi:hypothetical protein
MATDKTATHGNFNEVAALAQTLKHSIKSERAASLDTASAEAISQILTRIARIIYGDENHAKHWRDIQGFCQAKLDAAPPTTEIESDIKKLVRSLPTVRMEKANGTP